MFGQQLSYTNGTLLMLATLFSLLGCKQDTTNKNTAPNPMQEYRWQVTESAPKEYVMKIISGYFEAADGYKKDIPSRAVLHKGWGTGRSWIAAGREEMPLPKRMEITWFSYREDTFWHGAFDLPHERLQKLFQQTMVTPYTEKESRYQTFVVGIAPKALSLYGSLAAITHGSFLPEKQRK